MNCFAVLAYFCGFAAGAADVPSLPSKPAVEQSQKQNIEAAELKTKVSKDRKVETQKDEKFEAPKNEKATKGTRTCRSASWGSSERWVNGKLVASSDFKSPVSTDCDAVPTSWDRPFYDQPRRNGGGPNEHLRFDIEEL